MPLQYRYESPRKKANARPLRSDWIDEADASSHARLEEKGWRIVERREVPESEADAAAQSTVWQPTVWQPTPEWMIKALAMTKEQIELLRQFGVTVPEDAEPQGGFAELAVDVVEIELTPEQIEQVRAAGHDVAAISVAFTREIDAEDATPPEDIKQPEDAKPTELEIALTDVLSAEQLKSLHEAGYTTIEAIRAATDDALRDVKGVGPAAVRDIRKVLLAGG